MCDKSIDPADPNFDAGFATVHHGLESRFHDIDLESEDQDADDTGDEDDHGQASGELTDRDFRDL